MANKRDRSTHHIRAKKFADDIRNGEVDLSDWDIDELLNGRRRARDGTFKGSTPKTIPRELHQELTRRVQEDVRAELTVLVHEKAGPVLRDILNGDIDPSDVPGLNLQSKVVQDLLDRLIIGRQERVEVSGSMEHEHFINDVTIDRTLDEGDIVDADVVDDDEGDDFIFGDEDD